MNAAIKLLASKNIFQLSDDSSRNPAWFARRQAKHDFRFAGWSAALCLLLFSAPLSPAHQSPPGCTGSGLGIQLFTGSSDVHIGDTLNYSITVFNGAGVGPVVCDATSIQAFIVTPDLVSHPITLVRTNLSNGQADFYNNAVSYVVRSQDMRSDGTVRATASDTGTIHQNDTDSQGGGNQGVNTEVSLPCIQITAQCTGSTGENGAITFSGTVTNCGNNALTGVTVTNFVNGGQFLVTVIGNLNTNQSATFSGSWVPANPCSPSTATLTASGTDSQTATPRTVTSSANTTCSDVLTAGIKVTKSCPVVAVSPGQLLIFSGSVSNTGNVTLTNIVVVNNQPAANTLIFTAASLAPGAVTNFTGSYLAPTNCSATDTLTATAASRCGAGVSSTATATCPILTTPQIAVTATCPVTPIVPGGSVTYSGTVQNVGDITLTNVVVVSDRPVANTTVFTANTLAPGASANFTGTYTVPTNACSVTTTFSATGRDKCTLVSVTNIVSTTCTVTTSPGIGVRLSCPGVAVTPGSLITYTGNVTNSGNVILNNVTVVNTQAGTVLIVPSLAPHASSNFVASFITPAAACSVSSTVTATASDNCTGAFVTNTASTTCSLTTTPLLTITQNCPESPVLSGGLFTYSGSVSNAGNITLTNVAVVNSLSGVAPVLSTNTLAPGEVASFTGSYTAPASCSTTSTSTTTGRSTCGIAVTNSVNSTCPVTTTPLLTITQNCPVSPVSPGGSFAYSGSVSNAGNITITNVTVLNNLSGATPLINNVTLAPGASVNFTGSYIAPTNCSTTSTTTVTGRSVCGVAVNNTVSPTCPITTTPVLSITQNCPAGPVSPGGLFAYSGSVSNAGNITITNITVLNNLSGAIPLLTNVTLLPHATSNFTGSYFAPASCSTTSTSTATGQSICGVGVTNTVSPTCPITTTPLLSITQSCPVNPVGPGGLFTYSGSVSNAGNITLTNVAVVNSLSGVAPVLSTNILAPGEVASFTGSYTAPASCSTTSTSTASARSICGVTTASSTTVTCPITTTPAIVVTQTCPITSILPGGILTYSGTVSNAGNFTLTNIIVMSDRPASNTVVFTKLTLAPGAIANFSGSYQVPSNCCVVSSTLRASGQGCAGVMVTDSYTRTCTVFTAPGITVTKTCASGVLRPGDLLTYSGIVSNSGNITLINVTVVNNQPPEGASLLGPITLAPGESASYTTAYVVPTDFCGSDTVTASGSDVCTFLPVSRSVTTTCPITTAPRITITKNCPLSPTPRGGLYIYSGSVSNAGNVTLVNVFVTDNSPTNNTIVIGPITLAPGTSAVFTNSYIAPSCCCLIVDTLLARGQDQCSASNVTATATTVCPLLSVPAITVTKNCPTTNVPVGGTFTYNGLVSNPGNVVLTNVFVFSSQPATNTLLLGPIELAPNESKAFTGSYTVTTNSNPATDTVTASGTDSCQGRTVTAAATCAGPVGQFRITSVGVTNGVATVTWMSVQGTTYTLQSKTNLPDINWFSVPGDVTAVTNTASKNDDVGPTVQHFYRVKVTSPPIP